MKVNYTFLSTKNHLKPLLYKHHSQKNKMEVIPKVSREGKTPFFLLIFGV